MLNRHLSGRGVVFISAALAAMLCVLPSYAQVASPTRSVDDRGKNDGSLRMADKTMDTDGNFRRAPTYARASYVWPFATGPSYGEVEATLERAPGVVITNVGAFRLADAPILLPDSLKAANKLSRQAAQYFVVQAQHGEDIAELRQAIESTGGAIVGDLPVNALIAKLTPAGFQALQTRSGVGVEPYHPALKLDPTIGRIPLADPVKALSDIYALEVRIFAGENAEAVASSIAALGGSVKGISADTVLVEIHRTKLGELAALEPVAMIFEQLEMHPHGEETTTVVQTGRYNQGAIPFHDAGIDGSGNGVTGTAPQVLMVLDSGISVDAGDLSNTRTDVGTIGPTHRKVRLYASTSAFGGQGDTLGCDAPPQGGFTHGHVVSATALGNATDIVNNSGPYGASYFAFDTQNNPWKLDGVAPGALLVAYDGQQTPPNVSCSDPLQDTIVAGDLYTSPSSGSLGVSYTSHSARVTNFSWGADSNTYSGNSIDIDVFLNDKKDAMVFVSAGNAGADDDSNGIPDEGTLGTPATTKNGLAIGASRNATDPGAGAESRAAFSSMGPAVSAVINRIAPQLMAPGDELGGGTLGLASEFSCRSNDNDQANPVICDVVSGVEGTSFSSPAAAGAALLVRDYFAQGFYPTGAQANGNRCLPSGGPFVCRTSGALVKSVLIASSDFMTGANLTRDHRFNNEQGYGRIQLDNALPLSNWPPSPSGLVVVDGGIANGLISIGLPGVISTAATLTQSATFQVCDDQQELRIALSWIEGQGAALINDLDLEILPPAGTPVYYGNYFTDDNNRNGALNAGEDCPAPFTGAVNLLDAEQWSLPSCVNSPRDVSNPTEAVFLSPDFNGDGLTTQTDPNPDDDNQVEVGTWTVRVKSKSVGGDTTQEYALAVSGGVCLGSSVRFDAGSYTCNSLAKITINEFLEPADPNPTAANVSTRTTVQVFEGLTLRDTETGISFTQVSSSATTRRFESADLALSDSTARQDNNGVLDVRDGDRLVVTYADVGATRTNSATVDCTVALGVGAITFDQFGQDASFLVTGGCERNARGLFEFGFPDRYMDENETLTYGFAFSSGEGADLNNVEIALRCVDVDADSPASCLPTSTDCADPKRQNNTSCNGGAGADWLAILDSPQVISFLPAGQAVAGNFTVVGAPVINGPKDVEMVLEVTAATSGKTAKGVAINRHKIDVDEASILYSTDFPTGGVNIVVVDRNNNEVAENPTTNIGDFLEDYRFETKTYGDMTAGLNSAGTAVGRNLGIQSPWHFDNGNGGFTSGLNSTTDETTILDTIANWGEDKNFNDVLDGRCRDLPTQACTVFPQDFSCPPGDFDFKCDPEEDRDIAENNILDQNWGTQGGCGWQTRAPNTCSAAATRGCYNSNDCRGRCRNAGDPDGPHTNNFCTSNANCVGPETCIGFSGTCTGAAQATGGTWHTGRIDVTSLPSCMVNGAATGQCQRYEVVSGNSGLKTWFEMLVTPKMEKVNQKLVAGEPEATIEIVGWAWNQSIDLPDNNVAYTWEFDTDSAKIEPVDLYSDGTILNIGGGEYGAVTNAGNPDLTDGFSVFAPVGRCNATLAPCIDNTDCHPSTQTCNYISAGINGTVGNNRNGKNGCFFNSIPVTARPSLGLAGPFDDDFDNDGDAVVDEFVRVNGPFRNHDIFAWNGPDMRFATLEDIFGDTGNTFQAAVGLVNFESTDTAANPANQGYGLGIDDMVVEWREFTLAPDATDCAVSGRCATLAISQTNVFEGRTLLTITVQDTTPYGDAASNPFVNCETTPANPVCVNDCNNDGDLTDVGIDDNDCNNNGTRDVIVRVTSTAEAAGELVALDRVSVGLYRGEIAVSSNFDGPGILFVQASGIEAPVVTATYDDNEDGTGNKCRNDVDPAAQGEVQDTTAIVFDTGRLLVINGVLTLVGTPPTNGDNDGFADTNETIDMKLTIRNPNELAVHGITAQISSNDPEIDCILDPFITVGDIAARTNLLTTESFRFKVASVNRTSLTQDLSATFNITMTSDEFDALALPQSLTIDLDFDASGGGAATSYLETFEAGLGTFVNENLDQGRNNFPGSDGYRCQYSDPDWINSNSYGAITDCFLGASSLQADALFWHVDNAGTPGGGRSFAGSGSLHYGVDLGANGFTTPMAVLEAVRSNAPINLSAATGVVSELTFIHQTSLMDRRSINSLKAADRMVPMVALSNGATPILPWIKVSPYLNAYDQQNEDNYTNCMFDPVDDGSDEDDFFDPTDPDRRLGPSSTCFPEFSYVHQGDTFNPFSVGNIGTAPEGPGLAGATGLGTWIESKVDLSRFRGRQLHVRFLATALKAGTAETYEAIFAHNPDPGDDGVWLDNVAVSNTLTTPATLLADPDAVTAIACGAPCQSIVANLVTDPASGNLAAPGQVVELDASGSVAGRCTDGTLQFRFCVSTDNDCSDAGDDILRSWTDNPILVDAPVTTSHYVVEVRCTASVNDPTCNSQANTTVNVDCPGGSAETILLSKSAGNAIITWVGGDALTVDWVRGAFSTSANIATYSATCQPEVTGTSINTGPLGSSTEYYLIKKDGPVGVIGFCNSTTWQSAEADEPARDTTVGDPNPGQDCP